jgi:Uma2 family endonuclease
MTIASGRPETTAKRMSLQEYLTYDDGKETYRAKHSEYSVLDIPEYWIVDPIEQILTVCTDGAYTDRIFTKDEPIVSLSFPGLKLTADEVLTAGD